MFARQVSSDLGGMSTFLFCHPHESNYTLELCDIFATLQPKGAINDSLPRGRGDSNAIANCYHARQLELRMMAIEGRFVLSQTVPR